MVAICFLAGLIGGWATLRRFKRRILRGDNDVIERVKEAEDRAYQVMSKAERLRRGTAWIASTVVFGILDFIAYQTTLRLFSDLVPRDLTPQMVIVTSLAISGTLAALFGVIFYQRISPKIFPDANDAKTSPD